MEGTELTLRWEKFGLSRGLHEMLATKDLVDVTIACQGEYMQAHKTVLAACSSQFRKIFLANPCQHPVIFMQDSKLSHLQAVLNFMYTGEATVLQHELAGFMKTAEALKVSGLTTPAQGPGPVLHQKKPDAGVPPPKKTRTSQAQPWVNLHGMKMETPGVYIVEPGQLQASVNMDTTEISETERAVESVEAQEQVEEDQDDDHYAGGGDDDDDGDPDWFDESAKEHDEGNTSQPSTSAGVSSRDVPGFIAELEDFLINGQSSTSEEQKAAAAQHVIQEEVLSNIPTKKRSRKSNSKYGKTYSKEPMKKKEKKSTRAQEQSEESAESDKEVMEMQSDDSDYEPPIQRKKRNFRSSSLRKSHFKYPAPVVNKMKYKMKYPKEIYSPNPCRCSFCGTEKVYKNGNSLMQHIYRYHSGNFYERQKCSVCISTFANPSILKRHLLHKHAPNFDPVNP